MEFKAIQQAVANLNWNLNFYTFCREILQVDFSNESLERDAYCLEKWEKWQKFNSALHFFDDETIKRILDTYRHSSNQN